MSGGIAVFRALQLGDLLCAVPALRALRRARPEERITLIGLPWAAELAARLARYVDEFVAFPGHPALPERTASPARLARFLAAMRRRGFALALQMHGSGTLTNGLVAGFGARQLAGFREPAGPPPPRGTFLAWRSREHEIDRLLRLLAALGMPACGRELEFPVLERDLEALARLERRFGFAAREAACVHAGAQLASRRWAPERFAQVADALAARGLQVVLTGTAGEAALCARVAEAMRHRAIRLAGHTSLGGVAALVQHARLLVCNDTGVSHLAAAFGTPSVVVCSGADPARWAPLDSARHRVLWHDVPCRPCAYDVCPIGHPCAEGVSAGRAIEAATEVSACAA